MIVLKHLAQQYRMDPYKLRQLLRPQWGKDLPPGRYKKWKWPPDSKELADIRAFLDKQSAERGLPRKKRPARITDDARVLH